jgi:hypothetical protein
MSEQAETIVGHSAEVLAAAPPSLASRRWRGTFATLRLQAFGRPRVPPPDPERIERASSSAGILGFRP